MRNPASEPAVHRRVLWVVFECLRNALQDAIGFIVMGLGIVAAFLIAGSHLWGWGVFVISIGVANLIYWFMGGKRDWELQARLDEKPQQAYLRRLRDSEPHGRAEASR